MKTVPASHRAARSDCSRHWRRRCCSHWRFEAYIEGFALRPPLAEIVSVDMVSGASPGRHGNERGDAEGEAQARKIFEEFMEGAGIARDAASLGEAVLAPGTRMRPRR